MSQARSLEICRLEIYYKGFSILYILTLFIFKLYSPYCLPVLTPALTFRLKLLGLPYFVFFALFVLRFHLKPFHNQCENNVIYPGDPDQFIIVGTLSVSECGAWLRPLHPDGFFCIKNLTFNATGHTDVLLLFNIHSQLPV